jgi:hypothetical protein
VTKTLEQLKIEMDTARKVLKIAFDVADAAEVRFADSCEAYYDALEEGEGGVRPWA